VPVAGGDRKDKRRQAGIRIVARVIYIILVLAVSAFAGVVWFGNAPQVTNLLFALIAGSQPPAAIAGNVVLAVCGAVVTGATAAFLLIYVILAVFDFGRFQGLAGKLEALRPAPGNDGDADLRNFYHAFRSYDELAPLAAEYGSLLHKSDRPPRAPG
jgi:hypothetical protein